MLIIVLIIVNIPLFIKIKDSFYSDKRELKEAGKYIFTPDIISLFRGEYFKDRISEIKFGMMIFIFCIIIFIEYSIISALIF